jgi:hypothetical protein
LIAGLIPDSNSSWIYSIEVWSILDENSALVLLRSVTPALIFARVCRDELISFFYISSEVELDAAFLLFFLFQTNQAAIPPTIKSTKPTVIPTAIPTVVEEFDVVITYGGVLVVLIGLVTLSDEPLLLLLIVDGSLNVKGSAQT